MKIRTRWPRGIPGTAWLPLLTVTTMLFNGCKLQHTLLYFPSASPPTDTFLAARQLTQWPSPATTDYRGFISSRGTPSAMGTAIVFHGNGGTAADRIFYLETLEDLGYRVILAEYPAYGGRPGKLGEMSFVSDALKTVRLTFVQFGAPLFLVGESLGCGVAAAVAKETSVPIKGIVMITPWDTLAAIAQTKFPFLPVRLFMSDSYDNISNLASFKGRIAVIGAERDKVIPLKHADNLYRSIANPAKQMWRVQGAGHNDLLFFTDQRWWQKIMDFLNSSDNG